MVMSQSRGAGEARQQLQSAEPTSRQRGRPTSTTLQVSKEKKEDWSRVPNGFLAPRQAGRLTVGRNITLTLPCLERCFV
jgi:hypothetical protein